MYLVHITRKERGPMSVYKQMNQVIWEKAAQVRVIPPLPKYTPSMQLTGPCAPPLMGRYAGLDTGFLNRCVTLPDPAPPPPPPPFAAPPRKLDSEGTLPSMLRRDPAGLSAMRPPALPLPLGGPLLGGPSDGGRGGRCGDGAVGEGPLRGFRGRVPEP